MGWSDLPSDLVISIATRLPEPVDYARFRAICKSWQSAVKHFRPAFFPWLAVIPDDGVPNNGELSFISDRIHKRRMPSGDVDLRSPLVSANAGWIMLVLHSGVPIIFNPVTGAQPKQLPPPYASVKPHLPGRHREPVRIERVFLADTLVAFVVYRVDARHLLAAFKPGDVAWSVIKLSSLCYNNIRDVVYHGADRKFYAMDTEGELISFRIYRSRQGKTIVGEVYKLAKRKQWGWFSDFADRHLSIHLVSDGRNLLQVKKRMSKEFEILKYCPDGDKWTEVINVDLGENALLVDMSGARLLPLPKGDGYGGRMKRNCIYFTDYDEIPPQGKGKKYKYVHYARIYDLGKGRVDPCFSTNMESDFHLSPAFMWFAPSLSVKN